MSCPYTEVLSESRSISASPTSTSQTIVIEFQLPTDEETGDLMSPVFHSGAATFLGESDDVLALETAYSLIPLTRWLPNSNGDPLLLVLDSLDISQVSNYDRWKAVAQYKFDASQGRGAGGQDPENPTTPGATLPYMRFGFTVGGGTINMTEGLTDAIQAGVAGGVPLGEDEVRAIGMTKDGVTGIDIPAGGLTLQLTGFFYPEAIDIEYLKDLAFLTSPWCRVNHAPFLTFEEGEVLFLGASGGGTLFDIVPITFDFNIKMNQTGVADAPFPAITMEGHQKVDYRYIETIDDTAQMQMMEPVHRYIHTVHPKGDFSKLKLPITG